MENSSKNKANVGVTVFLFLMALVLIFFSVKQQFDKRTQEKELTQKIGEQVAQEVKSALSKPSEFPDYDSLSVLKKLEIITSFTSWTPDAVVESGKTKKSVVLDKGKLAKAYVYIRASLDGKALTRWESIYLKMDNVGGHIFRKQSLSVPASNKTELLFALDSVPYLTSVPYSELRVPFYTDWFQFFRDGRKVQVLTFISSLRPALVEEVSIYYGCADGDECELSLVE